jgi:hypothetical protein
MNLEGAIVNTDKDSANISKDGLTGLKSKAYFLISLENSVAQLALPNPAPNAGVLAVYLSNAPQEDLVTIATMVDCQADYATHYKNGDEDIVAGVYTSSVPLLPAADEDLRKVILERFPKLRFGIAHISLQKDTDAEQALDEVARNAYDAMILQKPAV